MLLPIPYVAPACAYKQVESTAMDSQEQYAAEGVAPKRKVSKSLLPRIDPDLIQTCTLQRVVAGKSEGVYGKPDNQAEGNSCRHYVWFS